ncbi:MAG: hypothetical protein DYH13_04535 [Alphaproteobacteria bacterium PRO2]|nr:hypothetical protein [Alphaproteobacteria bacterium PRO2]
MNSGFKKAAYWVREHFERPQKTPSRVFAKAAVQGTAGAGLGAIFSEISKATHVLLLDPSKQTGAFVIICLAGAIHLSLEQDLKAARAARNELS